MRRREVREMVLRWCPPVSQQLKEQVTKWVLSNEGMVKQRWTIEYYASRMREHSRELGCEGEGEEDGDPLGAGLFCWYGQLLFFVSQYGSWSFEPSYYPPGVPCGELFLRLTFDFSLLYVAFDYYLDRGPSEGKNRTLALLLTLLLNPDQEVKIEGFRGAIEAYGRLVSYRPQLSETLLLLFECEVKASRLQKEGQLTTGEYLEMARDKGGLTALAIHTLITGESGSCGDETRPVICGLSLTPEESGNEDRTQRRGSRRQSRWISMRPPRSDAGAYTLGAIIQLLDDMMDVHEDRRDGIHTIATSVLESEGCLDRLWIHTATAIDRMENKYTLFKPFMMGILCYTLGQRGIFSSRLRSTVSPGMLFNRDNNFNILPLVNQWIRNVMHETNSSVEEAPPPSLGS